MPSVRGDMMKITDLFRSSQWVSLIFMVAMIVVIVFAINSFNDRTGNLGIDTLEDTIEQYAIACYATEGSYPPDLSYLEVHYGLILDEEQYIYEYEVFGSNILPIITVLERP